MASVKERMCFCLWHGPQYRFAYGVMTQSQIAVTWLEKLGMCDLKYTKTRSMFGEVAKIQGWDEVEGLAMTIISEELYEANTSALLARDTAKSKHA